MPLREEFENTGAHLFRWRSYLPLLSIGIVLLALRHYTYLANSEKMDAIWDAVCMSISYFGLAIRILTIGYTPRGTSGRNTRQQQADVLNTSGIYSTVRHPLYLGNFFMGLGISLFAHLWWLTLIYMLIFWLYYERIMFAEEAFLRTKFGEEYMGWATATPAFLPRFKNYMKTSSSFSLKNVLRREYNGFFAVILLMFLFEQTGDWVVKKRLEFDTYWIFIVSVGFVIWFVLRVLKKHTSLLNVDGR